MPKHIVPLLLTAAAFLYACGPRPANNEAHARKPAAGSQSLASSLDVSVTDGVKLAFHVTNEASKRVEVAFPSGLTHEFEVQDTLGRVMWRWSEGRLFTQAMQNRILERDETMTWQADWTPPDLHGDYVAVVSLKSTNHPIEQRVRFTLP